MIRRPAVTLMEVLIAMFIMAIGMLALLALFPVGAVSMAQALKDDRCAATAAMAENVAVAMPAGTLTTPGGIRHDSSLIPFFGPPTVTSTLVYVDPYGSQALLANVGGVIPRVSPSYIAVSKPLADRWFSLPDDIGFLTTSTPDTFNTGGIIDRGRRYSYAYLLRLLSSSSTNLIQLYVVVYAGRPVNSLVLETTFTAASLGLPSLGTVGTNSLTLPAGTTLKRGGWILDTSPGLPAGQINGFYRVTNLADFGATTTVEVQQSLLSNVTQITVMDYVAEVFDKGTSWRP